MAFSPAARRAIAIRNSIARKASNDNVAAAPRTSRTMSAALLAACVEAGGFDQNARFA